MFKSIVHTAKKNNAEKPTRGLKLVLEANSAKNKSNRSNKKEKNSKTQTDNP